LGEQNAANKDKENKGSGRAMVFHAYIKANPKHYPLLSMVFSVVKAKRSRKKQAQINGLDPVDWFLAIDGCLA
jgi:hypothetical protein